MCNALQKWRTPSESTILTLAHYTPTVISVSEPRVVGQTVSRGSSEQFDSHDSQRQQNHEAPDPEAEPDMAATEVLIVESKLAEVISSKQEVDLHPTTLLNIQQPIQSEGFGAIERKSTSTVAAPSTHRLSLGGVEHITVLPGHSVRFATTLIKFDFEYEDLPHEAMLVLVEKAITLRVEWLLQRDVVDKNLIDLEAEQIFLQEQECNGIFSHEGIFVTGRGQTLSLKARMDSKT
jgi:hypothetical protein